MVYLEINKSNYNNGTPSFIHKLNTHLRHKTCKIFLLIYMEGCGPCNETRPEWKKVNNVLSKSFLNKPDIVIASIDKDLVGKLKHVTEPMSFPTIRFITNQGKQVETYEDSDVSTKDRSIDSFVEWIQLKTGEKHITKSDKIKHRQPTPRTYKAKGGHSKRKHKRFTLKKK